MKKRRMHHERKKLFLLFLGSQSFDVSRSFIRSFKLASSNVISMREIVQLTIGFLLCEVMICVKWSPRCTKGHSNEYE